jgi:L-gulonolactone oxidase
VLSSLKQFSHTDTCGSRQVNREKNYVVVQPGIILSDLHAVLEENGLAMINVGSISDQTLGGCITTATHGSGLTFQSLSSHVLSFTLLTSDGSHVRCSRTENADLYAATLCGFGTTGILLSVQLQVEPYFNLREDAELVKFQDVLRNFEGIVSSAEHVRMWWFNQNDTVRLSRCNRSSEVR